MTNPGRSGAQRERSVGLPRGSNAEPEASAEPTAAARLITFTGRLSDASGKPLEGEQTLVFRIFDATDGGQALWEETHRVSLDGGKYSVLLGSVTPLGIPEDGEYELTVQPDGLADPIARYQMVVAVSEKSLETVRSTSPEPGIYRLQGASLPKLKKPIKQIVSLNGTLVMDPPDGTANAGAIDIDVDPSKVQARMSSPCPIGYSVREVAPDGTVTCIHLTCTVFAQTANVAANNGLFDVTVSCPGPGGGEIATGGGFQDGSVTMVKWTSAPQGNGWHCTGYNPNATAGQETCWVRCCMLD